MASWYSPRLTLLVSGLLITLHGAFGQRVECNQPPSENRRIYDFKAWNINKTDEVQLSAYEGKVVMIANVATFRGLNPLHYEGYNALYKQFEDQDFHILGFPCNNFNQEPGANGTEILNGIKYIRPGGGFVPNFEMFDKINVNGKDEHPLYTYLKGQCPPTMDEFSDGLEYTPIRISDVRWNFEEFLIDRTGKPRLRFAPDVQPVFIRSDIENLLREKIEQNQSLPIERK